jgi:hypothetical protein
MAELLRCKACGYVVDARRVKDVCPACGVQRKAMEGWRDPVGRGRRLLLSLDVHPIILHFALAFACCSFLLALTGLSAPALYPQTVAGLLVIFLGVQPVAVLAAFASGLMDARARFKRVGTPALIRKVVLGAVFFLLSAAAAVLTFVLGPDGAGVRAADAFLLGGAVACAALLGRIGTGLLSAILPGE